MARLQGWGQNQFLAGVTLDTGWSDATCPDPTTNVMGCYRFLRQAQTQPTPVDGTMTAPTDTL
jgi:hypothetical protein